MNWGLHNRHHHLPHWTVPHPHWHAPHPLGHSYAATSVNAGAYIGRVGALAVTFGIGTATAAGFCAACAYADSDDSTAGRSGTASNSQSVNSGPRRSTRSEVSSPSIGTVRTPDAGEEVSTVTPRPAATRHPASVGARSDATVTAPSPNRMPAELHLDLQDGATAPPPAQKDTAVMPSLATQRVALSTQPSAQPSAPTVDQSLAPASVMSTTPAAVASPPLAALRAPVTTAPQPAVVVASPPAASANIRAMVTGVVASLSNALSGGTPTVPADASLALMMGAARRGRGPAAEVSATTATTTTAAAAAKSSTNTTTTIEAERMALSGSGRVVSDRTASNGSSVALTGAATATATVSLPASTGLTIRAKTNSGSPNLMLSLDGQAVTTVVVRSTGWSDYTITGVIPAGTHVLSIGTSNSTSQSSLYLDRVTTMTGPMVMDFSGKAGTAPNSTFWTSRSGTGWDSGIQNYTTGSTYLDGYGNLVIKAAGNSTSGYTSGRVESKNKVSMGYGTVTARLKVPKGQGLWPAFWFAGADEDTTAWPTSGEIDVMELPSTTTTMYSTLHGPIAGTTQTQQAQIVSQLPDLSADYHNYWVRHLPNEITFGIDGQTLGTLTPASLPAGATWVYNRPMQVILNVAVGGSWAGAPDSTTQLPATMSVDYVRWDPPA